MSDVIIPSGHGLCSVKMRDTSVGKISTVTWGYTLPVSGTAADNAALIVDAITTATCLWFTSVYAAATTLVSVYVLENRAGVHTSFEQFVNQNGARTGSAVPMPQVALGIKKVTAFAGKAQRGRLYLPAFFLLGGDLLESGVIIGTRVTQLQTAATTTLSELLGHGVPMDLLHTSSDITPSPVQQLIVAPIVRTQRRRLPR